MRIVLRLLGLAIFAIVLAGAGAIWDQGWNGGALLSRLAGRDALVQACTPPLRRELSRRGFTPLDIELGEASVVRFASGSFGRRRSLAGSFTFTDGQDGPRVDGRILCTVEGSAASIEIELDSAPRRLT